MNDSYSKGERNSPIFFYTGNEGNIERFAENTGFMWDIAEEFKATLVTIDSPFAKTWIQTDANIFFYF